MKLIITALSKFVTNSSSCICGFSRKVLEDSEVQEFLNRYKIHKGFVGPCLGSRSGFGSFLVSKKQKEAVSAEFDDPEYSRLPTFEDASVYVLYGDEYPEELAYQLGKLLEEVSNRHHLAYTETDWH